MSLLSRSKRPSFILAVLMLTGCRYVTRGAWEEFKILYRREPIEKILVNKELSDEDRGKLALVLKATDFGKDSGLNVGSAYSQYAEVDSTALVWVLVAAPHLKLEPKTWWFPIVGTVPYKGFFSKEEALELKSELEKDGYDVIVRSSNAFSTLGYFNDPVLSTMLHGDEITLIDTILHESLHRTLWVPGDVEFNESLANFVGGTLAVEFFRHEGQAERAEKASKRRTEEFEFAAFVAEVSEKLEKLYGESLDEETMLQRKNQILEQERAKWTARGPAEHYSLERFPLNNASILSLRAYLRGFDNFQRLYERCEKDPQRFLETLKSLSRKAKNKLFDELRDFLEQPDLCAPVK